MTIQQSHQSLKRKDLLTYGILATPLAFAGLPLYIYAPDYYATEYGISIATMGVILLILRFIDAVQDPLIGIVSDKYAAYRPVIMMVGATMLVTGVALLFWPSANRDIVWFALTMLLAATAFSVVTINLNALGAVWSSNKHQETTIVAYRETYGLIGLIIAIMLPGVLMQTTSKQQAFTVLSIVLAISMVIALSVHRYWQQKYQQRNTEVTSTPHFGASLKAIWSQSTQRFYGIYAISMTASSIPAILVLFFIRDRLGLEHLTGMFLLIYLASGLIAIPFWKYLSAKISKERAWLCAMILAVLSFVWAYFLEEGDMWPYIVICIMSGAAFGGELLLPTAILPEHIHQQKHQQYASLYFSILACIAKATLACASAISLPLLDIVNFVPAEQNTPDALMMLSLTYAAIPCIIKLAAIALLWNLLKRGYNDNKETSNNNGVFNHV